MLIDVQYPANAQIFFGMLMNIISLNLLPTTNYFNDWFKLDDSGNNPLNENFNNLGYGALYVIQNMGTLCLVMLAPIVGLVVSYIFAVSFEGSIKDKFNALYNFVFFDGTIAFLNETYILLGVSCALNTYYLYWNTCGNVLNSVISVVLGTILVLFPVFVTIFYNSLSVFRKIAQGD